MNVQCATFWPFYVLRHRSCPRPLPFCGSDFPVLVDGHDNPLFASPGQFDNEPDDKPESRCEKRQDQVGEHWNLCILHKHHTGIAFGLNPPPFGDRKVDKLVDDLPALFSTQSRRQLEHPCLNVVHQVDQFVVAESLPKHTIDQKFHYARIMDSLRARGIQVPTNRVWVAAHAMETGAGLLSADRHYGHIEQIAWVSVGPDRGQPGPAGG